MTAKPYGIRSRFHTYFALILVVTCWLSSGSYDKVLNSGDEMVLSIDLSSVAHLPFRNELVIRVYNVLNDRVICQSYMVEQEEDGMFTCSLREPYVEFQNGANYFAMEMVSVQTGKHYLRQTLPTIYHLDSTIYDGYSGSINATHPMVLINAMLVSSVSVALKWGMDHLFNHLAKKETHHFFPPATSLPPRPWQTIARKQIYRNPHQGSSLTHMQQQQQQSPPQQPQQPQQQHPSTIKSSVNPHPSQQLQPSAPRKQKKSVQKSNHPGLISPQRRQWKLPRLTNEQSKTIGRAMKIGLMLSLVYPAVKGGTLLFHTMIPQNLSIFHIPPLNETQAAFMTYMGSMASRLLRREVKNGTTTYSYKTIDGYDIPLSSPLFGIPQEEDTNSVEGSISVVSPPPSSFPSSHGTNSVNVRSKNISNYYNKLIHWIHTTYRKLIDSPPPLGKPRCPLRFFIERR